MASQPIRAKLLRDIAACPDGWDSVWERVASGETQTAIAHSFGVSQGFFSRIIYQDPARVQAFLAAKKVAADGYADRAKQLTDDVPPARDAIAKVREQVDVLRWLATVHHREKYGEPVAGVNVVVGIGGDHTAALRWRMVEASRPLAALLGGDGDEPAVSGGVSVTGGASSKAQDGSAAGMETDSTAGARNSGDSSSDSDPEGLP